MCRAKLNLGHSAWYPYLIKCGISAPTASRRKALALDFLMWAEIVKEGGEFGQAHVKQGIDLIMEKPFNMDDFSDYILMLHNDAFLNTFNQSGAKSLPWRRDLFEKRIGFDYGRVLRELKLTREHHNTWSAAKRLEAKEILQILRNQIDVTLSELDTVDKRGTVPLPVKTLVVCS